MNPIAELVKNKQIIVCAGSGGVGKTTTAAAIALQAAVDGKKAAVLTIDPARRLASALGLKELSDEPTKVSTRKLAGVEVKGELHALMLDTKSTFDKVVMRYAPTPRTGRADHRNRFYRNISGTLSGTQEYMAMEKLYELHAEGGFDLLVIDTPPTRNALDFLDAPRRMTDFFESRVLRWFLMPYMKAGGGIMRVANVAAMTFLKVVKRIIGAEVLEDTAEFFGNLEGMYEGFKQRAREVASLLQSDGDVLRRRDLSGRRRGSGGDFLCGPLERIAAPVRRARRESCAPETGRRASKPSHGSSRNSRRAGRTPGSWRNCSTTRTLSCESCGWRNATWML